MKFTRIFILKALTNRDESNNSQNPLEVLKEIIISHPSIDFALALIISIFLLFTKYNEDYKYIYSNALNIYFIATLNVVTLLYYFALEYLDQLTMNPAGKSLDKIPELISRTSNNSLNNSQRRVIESSGNPNNNTNIFSFLSLRRIRKIQLPMILYKNWHLFKSTLHFFKIITTILSYFLSLIFCMIYNDHKNRLDKEKYFLLHLLILDFYEFYSGFRVCYFLIKIIINIFLLPVYISAIILGYIEDRFNEKLNNLVNTKLYKGRSSIKSPANGRVSEMEEYCSICLNSFQLDEMVSTLPCSRRHTFHTLCLEKWFLTTVTCPLCRSDFQTSFDFLINGGVLNREPMPFEMQARDQVQSQQESLL